VPSGVVDVDFAGTDHVPERTGASGR
jgi:hypothetical protein